MHRVHRSRPRTRCSVAAARTPDRSAARPARNRYPNRTTRCVCSSADLDAAGPGRVSCEFTACLVALGRGQSLRESEEPGWACNAPRAMPGESHPRAAKPTTASRYAFTEIKSRFATRRSRAGLHYRLRSRSGRHSCPEWPLAISESNGLDNAPSSRCTITDTEGREV